MSNLNPYRTFLDFDFTAQSTQTLSSNGTYTIGGMTWTKSNSGDEASAMTVTNGTGLVIKPSSSADLNNPNNALPALSLALTQIPGMSDLGWPSIFRVWAYVSADNSAANYDNAVLFFYYTSSDFLLASQLDRGYGISGQGLSLQVAFNSTTGSGADFDETLSTLGNANRIMMLEFEPKKIFSTAYFGAATTNGGVWPDPSQLTWAAQQGWANNKPSGSTTSLPTNGLSSPGSGFSVALGAKRAGSSTSLSITFARLRIDAQPYG
jgi:hypothetical protein